MSTRRELAEADAFDRRRLATAFVSGAPAGWEVEPTRPGRQVLGGVALAVLLAAGAALVGVVAPHPTGDRLRRGLIVSEDTGAAYLIVEEGEDPELRPVLNAVSAALVLGGAVEPTLVAQDLIDAQRLGEEVGVVGAPATAPGPGALVDSGWTACTAGGAGIRVRVAESPDVRPAPARGVTVTQGGALFVVVPRDQAGDASPSGAVLLPVASQGGQTDNLLAALHLQTTAAAVPVSRDWIDLFPIGAPLAWRSFGLTGFGSAPGYAPGHRVGDLLVAGGERLLLTRSGPVALTEFEATVYANVVAPDGRLVSPQAVGRAPAVPRGPGAEGTAWPAAVPDGVVDEPCAELETGERPTVWLRHPGPASAGTGVPAGETEVEVAAGRGAHVRSAGGTTYLVDGRGRAHPLDDDAADALDYGDHRPAVVPDGWLRLLGCGVPLFRDAALDPPTEQHGPGLPVSCGGRERRRRRTGGVRRRLRRR